MDTFPGKLAIEQRVLPTYRVPFFDALAQQCTGGLELFAGQPRVSEAIDTADQLNTGKLIHARNIHLLGGMFYFCLQPGFTSWLNRSNPDALIIEANPRYLSTPAAIRWMREHHRPVIGWGLGAPPLKGLDVVLREKFRQTFLSQLDAVISYSQNGAEEYAACGVPVSRIYVAQNSAAFKPTGDPPERPLAWIGKPRLLFIGRLQARKRLDLLFKACAALPLELQPDLTVVGDGPDKAGIESSAGVHYPATVFAGAKTGKELEPYFHWADLFVLPGTGGLAVQHALAYALPVVVGEGDGTQSQLVRPENGWQVAPGSLEELISTLKTALADPARLRRMGRESFRIARDEVNIEKMVETFIRAANVVVNK